MIDSELLQLKSAGTYRFEIDKSVITSGIDPLNNIRMFVGFSKIGPFNTPVFVSNTKQFTELFGGIDRTLEKRGSYFHRSCLAALTVGPIYCLNLLRLTNDDKVDVMDFSVSATGTEQTQDPSTNEYMYRGMYNIDTFYTPSEESFLDTIGRKNKFFEYDEKKTTNNLFSFTNIGKNPLSVVVTKASDYNTMNYQVTCQEWYGKGNVPEYLNESSLISDFMVDVYIISGNWGGDYVTNPSEPYKRFASDIKFSKYFDKSNGLIRRKKSTDTTDTMFNQFLNEPDVNLIGKYTGCLIPGFIDKKGNNIYIEYLINNNTDTSGIMCAVNEELFTGETMIDVNRQGIDMIGHSIYNVVNEEGLDTLRFLSYNGTITGDLAQLNPEFCTTFEPMAADTTYYKMNGTSVAIPAVASGDGCLEILDFHKKHTRKGKVDIYGYYYNEDSNNTYVEMPDDCFTGKLKEVYDDFKANKKTFVDIDGKLYPVVDVKYYELTSVNDTNNGVDTYYDYNYDAATLDTSHSIQEAVATAYGAYPTKSLLKNPILKYKVTVSYNSENGYPFESDSTTSTTTEPSTSNDPDTTTTDPDTTTTDPDTTTTDPDTTPVNNTTASSSGPVVNGYYAFSNTVKLAEYKDENDNVVGVVFLEGTNIYKNKGSLNTNDQIAIASSADDTWEDVVDANGVYDINWVTVKDAERVKVIDNKTIMDPDYYVRYITGKFYQNDEPITTSATLTSGYCFNSKHEAIVDPNSDPEDPTYYDITESISIILRTGNLENTITVEDTSEDMEIADNEFVIGYNDDDQYKNVVVGNYVLGKNKDRLSRIIKITSYNLNGANVRRVTCQEEIFIDAVANETTGEITYTVELFTKLTDWFKYYNVFGLNGFELKEYHMPNGSNERQHQILDLLEEENEETNLFKSLIDRELIQFRYLVDTFGYGIEPMCKAQYTKLCKKRKSAFAIINMPSCNDFKNSEDPSFVDANYSVSAEYIAKGANPDSNPSFLFTLPDEVNGASWGAYYYPYLKVYSNYSTILVPPAAYVSNNYIEKYSTGTPWAAVAGERRGVITGNNVIGVESTLVRDSRDWLEPMGVNAIIYRNGIGCEIYANKTAKQKPQSALSSINCREACIYIQDGVEKILENYLFEINDAQTRLEIKTLVDNFLDVVKSMRGVYAFKTIMDTSNNDAETIDRNMGVIDIYIEPVRAMEILVQRLTILRTGAIESGNFE